VLISRMTLYSLRASFMINYYSAWLMNALAKEQYRI
jgi:hypothetical protein